MFHCSLENAMLSLLLFLLLTIAGICLMACGLYFAIRVLFHLYYIATVRIFVFNNQDLDRLGEAVRQQLNKPNVAVINFWARDQKVYMYFRSMYSYMHLHEIFNLDGYEPNKEHVVGNDLSAVLEKLRANKLDYKSMSGSHL
ncbi:MAG: hypothetical protein V1765_03455 [bacterium]